MANHPFVLGMEDGDAVVVARFITGLVFAHVACAKMETAVDDAFLCALSSIAIDRVVHRTIALGVAVTDCRRRSTEGEVCQTAVDGRTFLGCVADVVEEEEMVVAFI